MVTDIPQCAERRGAMLPQRAAQLPCRHPRLRDPNRRRPFDAAVVHAAAMSVRPPPAMQRLREQRAPAFFAMR